MNDKKKSFILYLDQQDLFNKLPDDIAGKLIKHIFSYVNCESPEANDLLLDVAFSSIKQSLKRDLNKWESQLKQRSDAGKKSAEKRANEKQRNSTTVRTRSTNSTDSVNVSVSDSVSVSEVTKDIVAKAPAFNFKNELLSLGVNKKDLDDWLTVRNKKRASNTEAAFNGFLAEVAKANITIAEAVKTSAENSWSGFKAQWYLNLSSTQSKTTHDFRSQTTVKNKPRAFSQ